MHPFSIKKREKDIPSCQQMFEVYFSNYKLSSAWHPYLTSVFPYYILHPRNRNLNQLKNL
jgi:hypothetical protein